MKRMVAGLVVAGLVLALLVTPTPALAYRGGYPYRGHGHGGNGAYVVGGLAIGALTGVVLGSILASRPAVVYEPVPVYVPPAPVYAPAPVYVAPPPPVCSDYWVPDGYRGSVWIQGHWERACR
jgi:hypothetical protein